MSVKKLTILLLLFCTACHHRTNNNGNENFDRAKWLTKTGNDYPYRNAMLYDLMHQKDLHGVHKDSLSSLLGPPDKTSNGYLYYTIAQKKIGFFTLHSKTLVLKLTADSTLEWLKIHE